MDYRSDCLPVRGQLPAESTHEVKLLSAANGENVTVSFLLTSEEPELEELRASMEMLHDSLTSFDGDYRYSFIHILATQHLDF